MPLFQGNLFFCSVRTLKFLKTSRKDDFMSLAYMVIYLLNNCKMPFEFEEKLVKVPDHAKLKKLELVREYKAYYNLGRMLD